MPLHDYIREIYEGVDDPAYVIRFIDYLVSQNYINPKFTIKDTTVVPTTVGLLENIKTKETYTSFADFYGKVTGQSVDRRELDFLRGINVTPTYSLWRVLCRYKENDILKFVDFKYRVTLFYMDILYRISRYKKVENENQITLSWREVSFTLSPYTVDCKENKDMSIQFLEAYEDSNLFGVYYNDNDVKYLVIP
jgi:hypothetical protein